MEEKVENQDALDEAVSADAYINQTDDQAVLAAQKAFGSGGMHRNTSSCVVS